MPKGWTLVRPAWILELGKPAQPVVLPLIEPFGMRRLVNDQRHIGCLQIPECDQILKTCRISDVEAGIGRIVVYRIAAVAIAPVEGRLRHHCGWRESRRNRAAHRSA